MKDAHIILGLGFGDEGKGLTTAWLCSQHPDSLVVRFSGGHQVGHTVVSKSGHRHVFSNFGSGTLHGVPTFWSRYCTLFPPGFVHELDALRKHGIRPRIFLDPQAMVTTPYDVAYNRALELVNRHGSVGVGFGATIERHETPYRLTVIDLFSPWILERKLQAVSQYYNQKVVVHPEIRKAYEGLIPLQSVGLFMQFCKALTRTVQIGYEHALLSQYDNVIFEGSQGILLDMDHGFFPHVTRSYTTSRNAIEIIGRNSRIVPNIYYITRAYQSRHGNGPMTNEGLDLSLANTAGETNQSHEWQGDFRTTILDLDLLRYAMGCDQIYSQNAIKNLVVTCLDQVEGPLQATHEGEVYAYEKVEDMVAGLLPEGRRVNRVWGSWSAVSEEIRALQIFGEEVDKRNSAKSMSAK